MRLALLFVASSLSIAVLLIPSRAQEAVAKKKGHRESINKKFEDPTLDVSAFVKRFESESREVYAKRAEILAVCGVRPGMSVADVGAGTGAFTFLFAEQVGPGGMVYAVDIAPAFLTHLRAQAAKRGLTKVVKPVKGSQTSSNLPAGSVDLVFICDAYHHFEKPAGMLASIREALRPGGRVVLIDFDKRPNSSSFVKGHARAEKEVYFKEFASAGFTKLPLRNAPGLSENFVALFAKSDQPASP